MRRHGGDYVLYATKEIGVVAVPRAGTIRTLPFGEGDHVPGGAVLAELEEQ